MQATTEQPPAPPRALVNVAGWDRILRLFLGVILLYLGWGGVASGAWGGVFRYVGFLPLFTGLAGWCPFYQALGVSTHRS